MHGFFPPTLPREAPGACPTKTHSMAALFSLSVRTRNRQVTHDQISASSIGYKEGRSEIAWNTVVYRAISIPHATINATARETDPPMETLPRRTNITNLWYLQKINRQLSLRSLAASTCCLHKSAKVHSPMFPSKLKHHFHEFVSDLMYSTNKNRTPT